MKITKEIIAETIKGKTCTNCGNQWEYNKRCTTCWELKMKDKKTIMQRIAKIKKLFPKDYQVKFYRLPDLLLINMFGKNDKSCDYVFLELKNNYNWKWKKCK